MNDSDPTITIHNVGPLVTDEYIEGSTLHVEFTCPASGERFGSAVELWTPWERKSSGVRAALESLRRGLAELFSESSSEPEEAPAGQRTVACATEASMSGDGELVLCDSERRIAILAAFERVSRRFVWSGTTWVTAAYVRERYAREPRVGADGSIELEATRLLSAG